MSFVNFVVPTINRDTLGRTLQSLVDQTDPEWSAVVVADCVENFALPLRDNRILSLNLTAKLGSNNFGGLVRNEGMLHSNGTWTAFVDDDDRIDKSYVEWLRKDGEELDIVVFRMQYSDGLVLPQGESIGEGIVGISFAIRTEFQRRVGLWFPAARVEDWIFLLTATMAKARLKVSEHVAYYVKH